MIKIKSYTLSEMLVVLLLTSIVGALAFSVLNLVQKQMFAIQGNYHNKSAFREFEQSLIIDFNRYNNVKFNASENQLTCFSEIDSVNYIFGLNYVLKGQDTFLISIAKKHLFFKGNVTENGVIDAMKIDSVVEQPNYDFFVFKYNDANSQID